MFDFKLTISLGEVIGICGGIGALFYLWRALVRPLQARFQEHDLLWDEYSRKHGLPFRWVPGRRSQIEPLPEMPHIN